MDLWQEIAREKAARRPVVTATVVRDSGSVPRTTGAKMLVYPDGRTRGTVGGGRFEALVLQEALAALATGQSVTHLYSFVPESDGAERHGARTFGAVCGGRVEVYLEVIMPSDRLLIVGGGHCGRALVQAAALLDFSIVLADDRADYARPEDYPFANVEAVLHLASDFAGLPLPDEATYVVLVSKGFLTDEAALRRVLDTPAAYIGMIGSKRKRETVFNNLRAAGIAEKKLARVHAPIGLEIGAETPEEIAISILAEIIQVRAQRQQQAAN
ncbi:MAG: XdhC/CoxI family protein [Armatimonadota bacterium]|nr:XdhC/CoxI family protein [Armatimonadota bacterium]